MSEKKPVRSRGRPKDADKAAAILAAAGKQFTAQGMNRTTMQDVANEAGVSKLTVYNHFGTKEVLFQHVIQNKCNTNMSEEIVQEALKQTPEEGLFCLGMAFIGIIFNDDAMAMHRTIMSESRHDTNIAKLFYETGPGKVYEIFRNYFKHLEAIGTCQFEDVQRAVEVFVSFFTGPLHTRTVLQTHRKPTKEELEQFTRENVIFFMRIFGCQ